MHELRRARYGQVPEARTHDRDGYGTCAGAPGARTAQQVPGLRPSAETNDLGWPDWPPDNGPKLAGPDGLQIVLKIGGAGALDVEAPDRAAPARVPPAVNDRAMNLDGPRGGCQAGLVQLQVLVSGIADDQGDRDHALGHGIAPSWCAAARRLWRRHEPEHETAVLPARDVRRSEACPAAAAASSSASSGGTCGGCGSRSARPAASALVTLSDYRCRLRLLLFRFPALTGLQLALAGCVHQAGLVIAAGGRVSRGG